VPITTGFLGGRYQGHLQTALGGTLTTFNRITLGSPGGLPGGTEAFDLWTYEPNAQTLGAATQIELRGETIRISAAAAVTLTNANILPDGYPGQIVTLVNTGGFTITFTNGNNVRFISGANLALAASTSVTMRYDPNFNAGEWRQLNSVGI
jgi:hypothetical protein